MRLMYHAFGWKQSSIKKQKQKQKKQMRKE